MQESKVKVFVLNVDDSAMLCNTLNLTQGLILAMPISFDEP